MARLPLLRYRVGRPYVTALGLTTGAARIILILDRAYRWYRKTHKCLACCSTRLESPSQSV
ncbi:hypothetical protein ARMGADRAFT_1009857 [Armillaria gallica]|uniref:Uncharacterized protein n=1 Tax=Armillaria gallica TaxID=47427 RepID=A0A2H3DRT6_ARMGA|nr:hypothetical protein ARMGADRAFT_1009857 [Armillaria gallica]